MRWNDEEEERRKALFLDLHKKSKWGEVQQRKKEHQGWHYIRQFKLVYGTQTILTIIWHFVHHLDERQCANYTNISQKNNTSIVKWYKFCREVVTEWFWDPENTPKLGGFGKIVEMDESYFPGKPKYNRGRRLGEDSATSWKNDEKWVFGLTERDSLDAITVQGPSGRSRKDLLPHIQAHCLPGTIFCSDGWKAYNKLIDNLDIDDICITQ